MLTELNRNLICEISVYERSLTDIKWLPAKKSWYHKLNNDTCNEGYYEGGVYGWHREIAPKVIDGWYDVTSLDGIVYKKSNIVIMMASGSKHYRTYETDEEMYSDVEKLKFTGWIKL